MTKTMMGTNTNLGWMGLLFFLTAAVGTVGCDSDNGVNDGGDDGIPIPSAYTFESRFVEGESSVSYGGQVVRNLLINDLKMTVDDLGKSGAPSAEEEDLLRLYAYEDAFDLRTRTSAGTLPILQDRYSAIDTEKDLVGKIDPSPLVGFGMSADDLIREYFEQIASNSQDPQRRGTREVFTTEEGVDMSQMINKILLGAVAYSQATGVYLNTILNRENGVAREGRPFTDMEHVWDEAFGYFGAARDFAQYSDNDLANDLLWKDSNSDGMIDLESEYVYAFARNAGKRDHGGMGVDFTGEIFDAFLKGRTAIVNQASAQAIAEQRDIIVSAWEKLVAATVVHYINDTLDDMDTVTGGQLETKDNAALNTHWAEMKGYAFALQFNPFKVISDADLQALHELLGNAPTYAAPGSSEADEARSRLLAARDLLKATYSFSDTNIEGW